MNDGRKKDPLTQAMQRAHPTTEPSATLALHVAQLAEGKASELARRPAVSFPLRTFRNVVLGTLVLGLSGVGIAVGPRLYHANVLNEAITPLRNAPMGQATSYRLYANGTQKIVGEFYWSWRDSVFRARLERDDSLAIWEGETLYQSYPHSSLVERQKSDLWTEYPVNRLSILAFESMAFYLRDAPPLALLPDGRLVSEGANAEERTLIRRNAQGAVTELELQVWRQGTWNPFLRTLLHTDTAFRPDLFDTKFPGKKIITTALTEKEYLGKKTTLKKAYVNSQGEVYIKLNYPLSEGSLTTLNLTDEKQRRYISTRGISYNGSAWFFPVQRGLLPHEIHLTVAIPGKPKIHLTQILTPTLSRLPESSLDSGRVMGNLNHELERLEGLTRYAKEQKNWQRVLALTSVWGEILERWREVFGRGRPSTGMWIYRTEALRQLDRFEEARATLAQLQRHRGEFLNPRVIEQEERLLRPK